jgi:hypothetical protein
MMQMPEVEPKESWQDMLISQHHIAKVNVCFWLTRRYHARKSVQTDRWVGVCKYPEMKGGVIRMKHVIDGCRQNLEETLCLLIILGVPLGEKSEELSKSAVHRKIVEIGKSYTGCVKVPAGSGWKLL